MHQLNQNIVQLFSERTFFFHTWNAVIRVFGGKKQCGNALEICSLKSPFDNGTQFLQAQGPHSHAEIRHVGTNSSFENVVTSTYLDMYAPNLNWSL